MAFKYLQLAAQLQEEISKGIYPDKLPTEQVLTEAYQVSRQTVRRALDVLVEHGALGANMSGTGPTVFGLFDEADRARSAWEELKKTYRDAFLTETV